MLLLLPAEFFLNSLFKKIQEHCVKCLDSDQDRRFIVSNQAEESVCLKRLKNFTIVIKRFLNP